MSGSCKGCTLLYWPTHQHMVSSWNGLNSWENSCRENIVKGLWPSLFCRRILSSLWNIAWDLCICVIHIITCMCRHVCVGQRTVFIELGSSTSICGLGIRLAEWASSWLSLLDGLRVSVLDYMPCSKWVPVRHGGLYFRKALCWAWGPVHSKTPVEGQRNMHFSIDTLMWFPAPLF